LLKLIVRCSGTNGVFLNCQLSYSFIVGVCVRP
jgi:hypothetical protein